MQNIDTIRRQRINGPEVFDYDPFTLDFPALCLHCLPPPPTLHSSTPIPNSQSWSISPPDDVQYNALRTHFSSVFRKHHNAIAIATTAPEDDLSYPPPPDHLLQHNDPTSRVAEAELAAADLESRISTHLHDVFAAWTSLTAHKRSEIWFLEFARSVGRKALEIEKIKKEKELLQQANSHLKLQNDELSRLQQPREFRLVPPQTVAIEPEILNSLAERGLGPDYTQPSVGYSITDRTVHLDTMIERVIGRWKRVVKETRGGSQVGMAGQRSLSGDSLLSPDSGAHLNISTSNPTPRPLSPIPATDSAYTSTNSNRFAKEPQPPPTIDRPGSIGSDQDADADADMEEDDSYELTALHGQIAPEAPMAAQGFRITNGRSQKGSGNTNHNGNGTGMEGIETVQGYVRINA